MATNGILIAWGIILFLLFLFFIFQLEKEEREVQKYLDEVEFLPLLTPYEGTTHSDIEDGCELTYEERLERGKEEMELLLSDGKDSFREDVIKNCDFDYDDCYKQYFGMVVVSVDKETKNITWYLRED